VMDAQVVRRLAYRRVAATSNICVDERGLVTPVNLAAFGFRALCDGRIFLVEPFLDGLRTLFIGASDRLLWSEAPAFEIVANGAHR
jgi:hypothetical protein